MGWSKTLGTGKDDPLYPLAELPEAEDESEWRTTIVVGALDPHGAAAALPTLLPQLGIPVDAVGIVSHSNRRRDFTVADDLPLAGVGAERRGVEPEGASGGLPIGVIAVAVAVGAVVVIGGLVAWRRQS